MSWRRECNYAHQFFALAKIHSWEMAREKPLFGRGYILSHYNTHHPNGRAHKLARSLESKWNVMEHDVSKFIRVVVALNINGTNMCDLELEGLGFLQTYLFTLLGVSM